MTSLKATAKFNVDTISLRSLATAFRLPTPFSLRKIIAFLEPEFHLWEGALRRVGSVSGSYSVSIWKNGTWKWRVTLSEHHAVIGDEYKVGLFINAGPGLGDEIEGLLGPNIDFSTLGGPRSTTIERDGHDFWLRDNWVDVISKGIQIRLEVRSNPAPLVWEIVAILSGGLIIFGLLSSGGRAGKCRQRMRPDPNDPPHMNSEVGKPEGGTLIIEDDPTDPRCQE